jgi:DNA polymerase-3 subunit alpha
MKYDDADVFKLIGSGNTAGIFQLESGGMTGFFKQLRPSGFEDIIAGISLYRPGPMDFIPTYLRNKKHPEKIKYLHPSLKPILGVSYGVMIYQEQVMQVVRELAGYSYGRSDEVRRAMSKKKEDVMKKEREHFVYGLEDKDGKKTVPGCVQNGIPARVANELFDQMISFASYAFNKSHAAAYAVVAYQTAWLKTHYPVEFMAALMTSFMGGDGSQIARYIRNCTEMGIEVLPPCVMESEKKFSVKNGKVRFGLLGVKNVGSGAIDAILEARAAMPEMNDLRTFLENADLDHINKKAIESLILAGAFDCFCTNRAAHMAVFESLMDQVKRERQNTAKGQITLWDMGAELMEEARTEFVLPQLEDLPHMQRLNLEKEMMGIYLSGHPLDDSVSIIERVRADEKTFITTDQVTFHDEESAEMEGGAPAGNGGDGLKDGDSVCLAGIITSCRTLLTKKNDTMAFAGLEDLYGSVEVIIFPSTYAQCRELIQTDSIVVVRGRLNFKEDEAPKVLASKLTAIDVVADYYRRKDIREKEGRTGLSRFSVNGESSGNAM